MSVIMNSTVAFLLALCCSLLHDKWRTSRFGTVQYWKRCFPKSEFHCRYDLVTNRFSDTGISDVTVPCQLLWTAVWHFLLARCYNLLRD